MLLIINLIYFYFFFLLVMPSLGAAEESRDSGVEENHSNI